MPKLIQPSLAEGFNPAENAYPPSTEFLPPGRSGSGDLPSGMSPQMSPCEEQAVPRPQLSVLGAHNCPQTQ